MTEFTLTVAYLEGQPGSAAKVIETVAVPDAAEFLSVVPIQSAAPVVAAMMPGNAAAILAAMAPERAAGLLSGMERRAAAAVMRAWPSRTETIFDSMPRRAATDLRRLMSYDVRSVGACMDPSAPAFQGDMTVADALTRLRSALPLPEMVGIVDSSGRLTGTLTVRDLLASSETAALQTLVKHWERPLLDVQIATTALEHGGWNDGSVVPVVDRDGRFVGVLQRRSLLTADRARQPMTVPGQTQLWGYLIQVFIHCFVNVCAIVAEGFARKGHSRR